MRRVFFPLTLAIFTAMATPATSAGLGEMSEPPTPCIDSTDDVSIWIQLAGDGNFPPQRVFGKFTSWDPRTATIGFQSALSHRLEQIPVKSIRIEPNRPNPAAQMALPSFVSLGDITRNYPAQALSVVDGVLKLPECSFMHNNHQLLFAGELTLTDGTIHLKGNVFEVVPPQGGGGTSTGPKGG